MLEYFKMNQQEYWKEASNLDNWHFPAMPVPPALPDRKADDIRKAVVEAMKQPVGMFTLFRKGVF